MRRRTLLSLTLAASLARPVSAQDRLLRIGFMATAAPTPLTQPFYDAFYGTLAEYGLIVGRNLEVEYRYDRGDLASMAKGAAELAALQVDLIYAPTTQHALAAKKATTTIPVVFAGSGDPVGAGLVASLAQPGGNVTGASSQGVDLAPKQFQHIVQAFPGARLVAVLMQPGNPPHEAGLAQVKQLGQTQKIEITQLVARDPGDLEPAFDRLAALGGPPLIVFDGPFVSVHRSRMMDLARVRRIPTMWQWRYEVQEGGLMSFGPNLVQIIRSGAKYVALILKGARPSDLPVEQPTQFALVVNLRTARALGISLPDTLIASADEVIE